jgi:hypothetical protein
MRIKQANQKFFNPLKPFLEFTMPRPSAYCVKDGRSVFVYHTARPRVSIKPVPAWRSAYIRFLNY